jgi:hypothetical protein
MAEICEKSPIPVVLDEELIGTSPNEAMLQQINPAYIILKPSLLGGFRISEECHWNHLFFYRILTVSIFKFIVINFPYPPPWRGKTCFRKFV